MAIGTSPLLLVKQGDPLLLFSLGAAQTYLIQQRGLFFQIDFLSQNFTHLFSCRPQKRTRIVVIFSGHSHVGVFPNSFKGDRKDFAQGETLVLQSSPGLRLGGSLIHTCGLSLSCNRSNLGAPDMCACAQAGTASLASPAMSWSLEIVSKNLPDAICDVEAPCSATCVVCPPSSFTLSSQSVTLSWLEMFRKLEEIKMAVIHEGCEMNKLPVCVRLLNLFLHGFDSTCSIVCRLRPWHPEFSSQL